MLAVASANQAEAVNIIESRWGDNLDDAERRAADLVVDLEADETTCPACLTTFVPSAGQTSCPECGLAFG